MSISRTDPFLEAKFFWGWLTGTGKANPTYSDGSIEAEEMKNSPGGKMMLAKFYKNGCKSFIDDDGYGTYEALWGTVLKPSTAKWGSTAFQVGGFLGASATANGNGTVTFSIPNHAGLHSASWFHVLPNMPDQIKLPFVGPVTSPMKTIKQTFTWTLTIDKSKCPCPQSAPNKFQLQLVP